MMSPSLLQFSHAATAPVVCSCLMAFGKSSSNPISYSVKIEGFISDFEVLWVLLYTNQLSVARSLGSYLLPLVALWKTD